MLTLRHIHHCHTQRVVFVLVAMLTLLLLTTVQAQSRRLLRAEDSPAAAFMRVDTAYMDSITTYDNQAASVTVSGHSFTGPGPFTVHFRAEMTRKPDYCAWVLSDDPKFQTVIDQFRSLEYDDVTSLLDYEFEQQGTLYIHFTADFYEGGDTLTYTTAEPYQVTISESLLEVPNLITPESETNRVFLVRYQSLVTFEMWVYNRWGQQIFHTTDPSEGWDGSYNGSTVPTGAYYYTIKAVGTDGINYRKKGAINVLRTRTRGSSSSD